MHGLMRGKRAKPSNLLYQEGDLNALQTESALQAARMRSLGGTRQAVLRKTSAAPPRGDPFGRKARLRQQMAAESKQFLQSHPLCAVCMKQGRYTKTTVVDHIIPHRGDPKLFWDRSNWQSLCKPCHDKKTLTEDINPVYRY